MRDSEKGDLDRFSDIEHNPIDEIEVENREARHFLQDPYKEKDPLSILSRRTLLVSIIILIGFSGIFMWSWIFDALGVMPWFGKEIKEESNTPQTATTAVISLPLENKGFPELAIAPSPVQLHAEAPVPKATQTKEGSTHPNVSKTTSTVQGMTSGSTRDLKQESKVPGPNTITKSQSENQAKPETFGDIKKQSIEATPAIPVLPAVETPLLKPEPISMQEETISVEDKGTPENKQTSLTELQSKLPKQEGKPFSKQETLLLNRKPEHYTIQILGMHDLQKLKLFINQNPLKSKMVFYKTTREGKVWYVVVYGDFETKQKAEAALLTLPQAIQKNKPWTRSLREIQGAIRDKS